MAATFNALSNDVTSPYLRCIAKTGTLFVFAITLLVVIRLQ